MAIIASESAYHDIILALMGRGLVAHRVVPALLQQDAGFGFQANLLGAACCNNTPRERYSEVGLVSDEGYFSKARLVRKNADTWVVEHVIFGDLSNNPLLARELRLSMAEAGVLLDEAHHEAAHTLLLDLTGRVAELHRLQPRPATRPGADDTAR